jgi:REP element-mobilizing transposase RayT
MPGHEPRRRSIRLRGHDYALGGEYFVTICTRGRGLFFEAARLRGLAREVWEGLPGRFPDHVKLDAFVVMPNHVHGIIIIVPPGDRMGVMNDAPTRSGAMNRAPTCADGERAPLGEVVRTFKAVVTREARQAGHTRFGWQRGYYEHIIEDPEAFHAIRWYIEENPDRWEQDSENPDGKPDLRERMFLQRIRSRLV